jgi:hypothetical protein
VVFKPFWLINNNSRGTLMRIRELEASIRRTMRQHYGWNIGGFRDAVSDNVGTAPFVTSIVNVITEQPDTPDPEAPYALAGERDRVTWARLKSMRIEKGVNLEGLSRKMEVHEDFLEALEEGQMVTLVSFPFNYLDYIESPSEEQRIFCEWMFSDDLKALGASDRSRSGGAGPAQSLRGAIEKYYGRNLWQFRPEIPYEESIRPFILSLLELATQYRATSRAMKDMPTMSKHLSELLERTKADADRKGVHWMVLIAQQDAGMADIFSRMVKAELAGVGRIKE